MKSYAKRIAERMDIDPPADLDNFVQVREWLNTHTDRWIEYQRQHGQKQDAANDADPLSEYRSLSPKDAPANKATNEPSAPKDFDHFFAESKDGKEVLYRWRDSARAAFSDHGDHIQLHDKSPEGQAAIIAASLSIAKERAWREIEVTGDQEFRRNCWLEASLAGIQCRGYTPTPDDRLTLEQMRPGSAPAPVEPAAEAKITAVESEQKPEQILTEDQETFRQTIFPNLSPSEYLEMEKKMKADYQALPPDAQERVAASVDRIGEQNVNSQARAVHELLDKESLDATWKIENRQGMVTITRPDGLEAQYGGLTAILDDKDLPEHIRLQAATLENQIQERKSDPKLAINGEPLQPITTEDLAKEERKERDMDAMGVTHRIHELKAQFADLKPTERKALERIEGQNRGNDLAADTSRQKTGPGR
jgi:hypothetical protein